MNKKKIVFLLGTARAGRLSEQVARYVFSHAKMRDDVEAIFVDVQDFPQTATIAKEQPAEGKDKWRAIAAGADGFVIISPEYNHGYPGELKMLLDNAYEEYRGKPVAIMGVSSGPIGGARMMEQLKPVLSAFQMMIINLAVYFANAGTLFDETGVLKDVAGWDKRIDGVINEVVAFTR
jgi:NAD(P)H-dependent FMN reductase